MNQRPRIIPVNNPGGSVKGFRIQFRVNNKSSWQQMAVSSSYEAAQEAVRDLQNRGLQARIIHYKLPIAA